MRMRIPNRMRAPPRPVFNPMVTVLNTAQAKKIMSESEYDSSDSPLLPLDDNYPDFDDGNTYGDVSATKKLDSVEGDNVLEQVTSEKEREAEEEIEENENNLGDDGGVELQDSAAIESEPRDSDNGSEGSPVTESNPGPRGFEGLPDTTGKGGALIWKEGIEEEGKTSGDDIATMAAQVAQQAIEAISGSDEEEEVKEERGLDGEATAMEAKIPKEEEGGEKEKEEEEEEEGKGGEGGGKEEGLEEEVHGEEDERYTHV